MLEVNPSCVVSVANPRYLISNLITNGLEHWVFVSSGRRITCGVATLFKMPSETLGLVTTAVGVSVLAGLFSGLYYVISTGFSKRRRLKSKSPWNCAVCGGNFRSSLGVLEVQRAVGCSECKLRVCRSRCSSWVSENGWTCKYCQQPDTWFKGLLKAMQSQHIKEISECQIMDADKQEEPDEGLVELRKKEKEQVRDFIERLLEAMLGGNLDDVKVTPLYDDKNYDAMFERYHSDLSSALTDLGSALHISIANLPVTGQSPCSAHANLKQLVQRFIKEAVELPPLNKSLEDSVAHEDDSNRTYEDLLATAIINKVIQSYQDDLNSSRPNSRSSRHSIASSKRSKANSEFYLGEQNLNKYKKSSEGVEDDSSLSSIDEFLRSDSSLGSVKYLDTNSLKIRHSLDEASSSSEDEDARYENQPETISLSRNSSRVTDIEENWILQKRAYSSSNSPVPVPMLVPNPTSEAKVLIGDREAEDTTDLSDAASDFGDAEVVPGINTILVESKTIIGGKNNKTRTNSISEDSATDDEELKEEHEEIIKKFMEEERTNNITEFKKDYDIIETTNSTFFPDSGVEHDAFQSLESNTEKDAEYIEKYASLPRTILKEKPKPTPTPRLLNGHHEEVKNENSHPKNDDINNSNHDENDSAITSEKSVEENGDDENPIIPIGSYTQKEREKWKHPVEMPNNPYSQENIERRLSNKLNGHGRDYYIKEAKKSSGSRKEKLVNSVEFPSIVNGNNGSIEEEKHEKEDAPPIPKSRPSLSLIKTLSKSIDESDLIHISSTPVKEAEVFTAIPALVIKDDPSDMESLESTTRPPLLDMSSDSDLSIERSYNLVTGEVMIRKGDVQKEIIKSSKNPEGIKYEVDVDENHNDSVSLNHNEKVISNNGGVILTKQEELFYEEQEQNLLLSNETYSSGGHLIHHDSSLEEHCKSLESSIDEEITELQEKKLVKNILKVYSRQNSENPTTKIEKVAKVINSQNNIKEEIKQQNTEISSSINKTICVVEKEQEHEKIKITNHIEEDKEDIDEEKLILPKVKNLKKLFDNSKPDNKVAVYSLTARSIPTQVRQELRSQEIDDDDDKDESKNVQETVISEESAVQNEEMNKNKNNTTEDEEEVFATAKSKIAFFEMLKAK